MMNKYFYYILLGLNLIILIISFYFATPKPGSGGIGEGINGFIAILSGVIILLSFVFFIRQKLPAALITILIPLSLILIFYTKNGIEYLQYKTSLNKVQAITLGINNATNNKIHVIINCVISDRRGDYYNTFGYKLLPQQTTDYRLTKAETAIIKKSKHIEVDVHKLDTINNLDIHPPLQHFKLEADAFKYGYNILVD